MKKFIFLIVLAFVLSACGGDNFSGPFDPGTRNPIECEQPDSTRDLQNCSRVLQQHATDHPNHPDHP